MLEQIRGAIAGGVSAVQVREPDLEAREYAAVVRDCVSLARNSRCRVLVNDRLDVALAANAHGVHLRESSIPIQAARQLVGDLARHNTFMVGRSVHDVGTAAASATADYLIAGSVFETESKPGQPATLGLAGLQQIVLAAGNCPVWAIGGLTSAHVHEVSRCGIRGVAAIGAFLPSGTTDDVAGEVQKLAESMRFALDRAAD